MSVKPGKPLIPNPHDRTTQEKAYRNFILNLYRAEPVKGYNWLHGMKDKRMVHVGAVDAPVALGDVKSIIQEFWKDVGKSSPIQRTALTFLGGNLLLTSMRLQGNRLQAARWTSSSRKFQGKC